MNLWKSIDGYKVIISAVGMFGLAIYLLSKGEFEKAWAVAVAALAVLGIGHKSDKNTEAILKQTEVMKNMPDPVVVVSVPVEPIPPPTDETLIPRPPAQSQRRL